MNNRKHSFLVRPLLSVVLLGLATIARAEVPPPPVSPAPVVDLEYDAKGNFKKSIQDKSQNGLNLTTSHDYDGLSRRFKTTDARGKPTAFGYNGREDLTSVTDPRSLVTSYPRNGLGDTTGLTSPDTGTATHTVDAAGKLLTRTDSRGVLATYGYDGLSRLTSVTYSQSGQADQVFTWSYDQTGAGFSYGLGRLTSAQFPAGSAIYAYDPLGRLVSTTQTVTSDNTVSLSTGYGYDAAGHITSITYPSGRVLSIPHSGGQPTGMSLAPNASGAAVTLISDLSFEPGPGGPGPARAWNWQLNSGTLAHTRVFDVYGRMVRYPLGGALRDLTYDAADRIASYTHWDANTGAEVTVLNQSFGYDELGRLTSITTGAGSWTIGYDDNGNRSVVSYSGPGGASTRNYATSTTSNRLQSLDNPSRTLGYDTAGNILADDQGQQSLRFTVDLAGRIAQVSSTVNGLNYAYTGYAYNADGQRVLRKDMGGATCGIGPNGRKKCDPYLVVSGIGIVFVYDQEGQLLGEYKLQDGSVLREYVWLQGMPVAVIDGTAASPQIYYVQTDHLGTPRTVIDRSGVQRWSWVAEPFGNSSPVEDPVGYGVFTLNLRMPGQYFDVESGLAYNWNRSYDAGLARYTQSDPIGLVGGINTYAYVGGNPLSYVDPMGLIEGWTDPSGPPDMIMQRPSRPNPYNFRTPAYESWMTKNAGKKSKHKCATYVRKGLEAGGADTRGHPTDAKDYNDTLIKNGFYPVPAKDYMPMPGDTIVFQPYPGGNPSGHIQTYNGRVWVSDFFQNQIYASQGYGGARYQIYRAPDCECDE